MDGSLILLFLLLQRLFEMRLARKNERRMRAQGAVEIAARTYPPMVAMHLFFFLFLAGESWPWHMDWNARSLSLLGALLLLQGLRYWCIASLGPFWNTRILVLPGSRARRRGPYRLLRHPNYLAVTLELALLPALLGAPLTLFLFAPLNLLILRQRIRLEEAGLKEHTDYSQAFEEVSTAG